MIRRIFNIFFFKKMLAPQKLTTKITVTLLVNQFQFYSTQHVRISMVLVPSDFIFIHRFLITFCVITKKNSYADPKY